MPTLDHQDNFNVLSTPYPQMMRNYLQRVTEEALAICSPPPTLDAWQAQRPALRAALAACFGDLPAERCDLEPTLTGVLSRDGYRVEQVRLQTRPGWFAGVNVYLPEEQQDRVPAVLMPLGHFPWGRRSHEVQIACATLARRGYVALTLDMPGYGDRAAVGSHSPTTYFPLLTVGLSLGGLQLWDNMRCLDYLCSRPEVDPTRLGCTGASGGGSQTMYLTALDDRIAAAVPTVFIGSARHYPEHGCCVCEAARGVVQVGDDWRLLSLVAPRPVLVVNATHDPLFPIWYGHLAMDSLRHVYRLFDREEAVAFAEVYRDHGYYQSARLAGYAWFDRWLQGVPTDPREIVEAPVWTEPEDGDTLFVEGVDRSVTIPQMIAHRAQELLPSRSADPAIARDRLLQRCLGGLPEAPAGRGPRTAPFPDEDAPAGAGHAAPAADQFPPPFREGGRGVGQVSVETINRRDHTVEKLALRTEPDILVPALLLKPVPAPLRSGDRQPSLAPARLPVCLYLHERGKQVATHNREVGEMLRAGWAVCAVDVRGSGETGPPGCGGLVQKALVLGRTLAALQVFDLLRTADYLQARADLDATRLAIWGEGCCAFLALLAAALDERFTHTCGYRLLTSYLHDSPSLQDPLHYLPDVIREVGDICDLAALVAPRTLVIAAPRNASLEPANAAESFRRTVQAYGADGPLTLVEEGYEEMLAAWLGCLAPACR